MNESQANQDDELVSRLKSKGQAALADLFREHRQRLRRMVDIRLDQRVAGRVDASDVLQETYLDASRQLDGYLADLPMPPFLWLRFLTGQRLMATHRHHLGVQKRDAKQEVPLYRDRLPPSHSGALSYHLMGRLSTPSRAAAREEVRLRIRQLLDDLDPVDREILSLRHFEELSNGEAAQELDISTAASSKRYIRALERVRKALAEIPGVLPD